MPRFPWSPLLIFLSLIPDECFTIPVLSESLENQKNVPFLKFRDQSSSPMAPNGLSEKEQVKEEALRQILRALSSVLPQRFHQSQRTFIKNDPPPRVLDKSQTPNASPPPRRLAPKGPLAKMLDEYPKNKPSIYIQDLSSFVKRVQYPNKLQESVGWIKSDQSENENNENLSSIENKPQKKVRKVFDTSSRYIVKLNPPTTNESKRAMKMKERCGKGRKNADDTICFKYPKNATYYYPVYYYPAYYYPYYYPYYYWGRR